MIKKILVANRGEIAIRIMRTARKMGIATVAVYSNADKNALFLHHADEAVCIGGYQPGESYLVQDKIIEAAKTTGVDAIHPGYGFLSENETFARRCQEEGLIFIGPSADAIYAMGDKKRAKEIVSKYQVPIIPGYNGADQQIDTLQQRAIEIGFPVLLKASAGGGGKGMRIVRDEKTLLRDIEAAQREALAAFGDNTLLIEKYFDNARHIEFQIMGDKHGHVLHLFERECSIQRRYQKIIEESPSPALTPELRETMGHAAVNAAKAIRYDNAGTVEFILTPQGQFYFLEVNTRLQVEHPVTEMVTGLDLVQLQIEIAEGKPLPFAQKDVHQHGYAIEVRLYAEDAYNQFLPATGTVLWFQPATGAGARFDSGIHTGSTIDIYYDPMIAKIISHGHTRDEAIRKMLYTLRKTVYLGTTTNKHFLRRVLNESDFIRGEFDTSFIATHPHLLEAPSLSSAQLHLLLMAATLHSWHENEKQRTVLRHLPSGWRNVYYQPQQVTYEFNNSSITVHYYKESNQFHFTIDQHTYIATLEQVNHPYLTFTIDRLRHTVALVRKDLLVFLHHDDTDSIVLREIPRFPDKTTEIIKGGYKAPMPGEVIKIFVKIGDVVKTGDPLLVLMSMKMENVIEAQQDGIVEEIYVSEKGFVEADTLLLKLSAS